MFERMREKALMKALNKIEKELRKCDFTVLRHQIMKQKWDALRGEDDFTYDLLTDYEELVNVLEKIFKKEEELCQ